jgi:hypothetical protein
MAQPTVDDIPKASDLQAQLAALNQAIAVLSMPGASLGGVYCIPGPPPEPAPGQEPEMLEPVQIRLRPPLDDPPVINGLVNTMQRHARAIEKELADMGYA